MASGGLQVVVTDVLPSPSGDRRIRAGRCVKGIGLLAHRLVIMVVMVLMRMI